MAEYNGQQLTPLAQVLSYEVPSFNSRIDILRQQKERIDRNKALKDQQLFKEWELGQELEMQKELLGERAKLSKEEAVAAAAERGKYDVEQAKIKGLADVEKEKIKYIADVTKDQRAAVRKQAEEQRTELNLLWRDGIISEMPVIEFNDDMSFYNIKVGDKVYATTEGGADFVKSMTQRSKYIKIIDDALQDENTKEESDGSNLGRTQLRLIRAQISDLDNTAVLEQYKGGISVNNIRTPKTVDGKEDISLLRAGQILKTFDSMSPDVFKEAFNVKQNKISEMSVSALTMAKLNKENIDSSKLDKLTPAQRQALDLAPKLSTMFAEWANKYKTNADPNLYRFNTGFTTEENMFIQIDTPNEQQSLNASNQAQQGINKITPK